MAISLVDTTSTWTPATDVTIQAPTPVGIQAGDLLLASGSVSGSGDLFANASYSGWTIDMELVEAAMVTRFIWRIADGTSADAPPVMTANAASPQVANAAAYRGVDNTNPFIAKNGQVHSPSSSVTHTAPALTNTDAGAWLVGMGHARQVATPLTWSTYSHSLVEREDMDAQVANTNNVAAFIADSNGPVATGSYTVSAATSLATAQANMWAALLRPAVGGGPSNLDRLKLGSSILGLRVGVDTPSKVYAGAVQIWP